MRHNIAVNYLTILEQSRRDDLEAIGNVMLYFLRGDLPWQGLKIADDESDRYKRIFIKKKETSVKDLCKNYPGFLFLIFFRAICCLYGLLQEFKIRRRAGL